MKFLLCNILPGLNCIWNDVYEIHGIAFFEVISMCAHVFFVCARLMASLEGTLFKTRVI